MLFAQAPTPEYTIDNSYMDGLYFSKDVYAQCTSNSLANLSWVQVSFIALAVSAGVVAIAYMLSKYFQIERLNSWVKDTIYHILISALLVVLLMAYTGFNVGLIPHISIANPLDPSQIAKTPFDAAMFYIGAVQRNLAEYYFVLTGINMVLSVLSQGVTLKPVLFGLTFNLGPMLAPLLHTTTLMLNGTQVGIAATIVYGMTLCFIGNYALSLLLPLGILLRTFYFSRDVGASLIAIAISFFVLYPLMLNLNYLIVQAHFGGAFEDPLNYLGFTGIMSAISGFVAYFFTAGTLMTLTWKLLVIGLFKLTFATFYVLIIGPFLTRLFDDVIYYVVIVAGVLPIINIFVTLTFAREFSKLMGAEISLAPLARLI